MVKIPLTPNITSLSKKKPVTGNQGLLNQKSVPCSPFTDGRADGRTDRVTTVGHPYRISGTLSSTYCQGSFKKTKTLTTSTMPSCNYAICADCSRHKIPGVFCCFFDDPISTYCHVYK